MFNIHFPAAVFHALTVLFSGHRTGIRKKGLTAPAAILAAFLALAFVLLPASADTKTWDCGAEPDTVTCTLADNGTFTVSGEGDMWDYELSSDERSPWYAENWNLIKSVVIEEGVTSVGNYAFHDLSILSSVTIGGDVTSIGERAFSFSGLTSVTIPESVINIGKYAFDSCSNLSSLIFSGTPSLKKINESAFIATKIKSVTIPASVTLINFNAFTQCRSLNSVTIIRSDETPLEICPTAFHDTGMYQAEIIWEGDESMYHSFSLINSQYFELVQDDDGTRLKWSGDYNFGTLVTKVSQWDCGAEPDTVTCTLTTDGKFTVSGEGNMLDYGEGVAGASEPPWFGESIKSVVIEEGVTSIGEYAFGGTQLTSVTIPSSVTLIGSSAFSDCVALSAITINRSDETPLEIKSNVFVNTGTEYAEIFWQGEEEVYHRFSLTDSDGLQLVQNESSLLYWSGDNCYGTLIRTVPQWDCGAEPDTVTCTLAADGTFTVSGEGAMADYGAGADGIPPWLGFENRYGIKNIVIEKGVTSVGNYTFRYLPRLISVAIGEDVTSIGEYDFFDTGLKSVTIPESVRYIGNDAFSSCHDLETIIFSGTPALEEIRQLAFSGTKIGSVTIPASVKFIEHDAFRFCSSLSEITIIRSDDTSLKFDPEAAFVKSAADKAKIIWAGEENIYHSFSLTDNKGFKLENKDGILWLKWSSSDDYCTLVTTVSQWDCGADPNTVTCTLTDDGKLTVSGEGNMANYANNESRPWHGYSQQITSLEIGEGVTSIGDNAFASCALGPVSIPSTVTTIGNRAFSYNTNISAITISAAVTSIGDSAFYACGNMPSFTIIRKDNTPLEIGKRNFEFVGIRQAALIWEGDENTICTFSIDNTEDYEIKENKTLAWSGFGSTTLTTTVEEKNYALSVTAPEFEDVYVGYERPEAKPVTIENTGNVAAAITSVQLASFTVTKNGEEAPVSFELNTEAGTTIDVDGTDTSTYTVQPVSGLEAGLYTAGILVNYDAAEPASATVRFKVIPKEQAELEVTLSEEDPTVPQYEVPEGTVGITVTYHGYLADGSEYGPAKESPRKPGEYTVTVTCETEDTIYSGSADFTITGPEPEPERPSINFFRLCNGCELPATGFSSLRPTILDEQPKDLRYEPLQMRLMLPTLGTDTELVTAPQSGNSWAVEWLGADAGILEGSALPGDGVSIIAAHNTLNDTEAGPFALLSMLEPNDLIAVAGDDGSLKLFRVYANELLEPDGMKTIGAFAGDDALVLVTCENESVDGGYLNRRAVFAK